MAPSAVLVCEISSISACRSRGPEVTATAGIESVYPVAARPEVIHRPVSFSQFGRMRDGPGDVLLYQRNGVADGASAGKVCRQSRGKRTPCAVCVTAGHTLVSKFNE